MAPLLASPRHVIDHLCREPRLLGAEVGQCLVLHTWKRDLGWHPHVHVIVTAGGWDALLPNPYLSELANPNLYEVSR